MALKVKAKEQLIKVGKYAETYRYVMMPELYTALTQDKVIKEAALRSGVSRGVMQASRRGQLKATAWHCLDWAPCASDCAPRAWTT